MGKRKLEARESAEAGCLAGSYPGTGSLSEVAGPCQADSVLKALAIAGLYLRTEILLSLAPP